MIKILSTIGPRLHTVEHYKLAEECGCSMFRVNLGKKNRDNIMYVRELYEAKKELNNLIVFLDMPASKNRISMLKEPIFYNKDEILVFTNGQNCVVKNELDLIPVTFFDALIEVCEINDQILISDGKFTFTIIDIDYEKNHITIKSDTASQKITVNASVRVKDKALNYNLYIPEDINLLKQAMLICPEIEWVVHSFTNQGEDIKRFRDFINEFAPNLKIMAKIETVEGVKNYRDIINCSDGVMVGRGDLGVEIKPYLLPAAQKQIVNYANEKKKFSVVATDFMVKYAMTGEYHSSELIDTTYTIEQNPNAIMLSGESAASMRGYDAMKLLNSLISEYGGKND